MNIVVCNDVRREALPEVVSSGSREEDRVDVNLDCVLIRELRRKGHTVALFDGYESDLTTPVLDPHVAGARLGQLILELEATGLVYDIHYFGNFTYGLTMLRKLSTDHSIPADMKVVVYSRFLDRTVMDVLVSLGIPREAILDRNAHRIEKVISLFP